MSKGRGLREHLQERLGFLRGFGGGVVGFDVPKGRVVFLAGGFIIKGCRNFGGASHASRMHLKPVSSLHKLIPEKMAA